MMAYVGLKVSSVEVVNNTSLFIMPMVLIANTFVVRDNLPDRLRTFADWNLVSALASVRELFGNTGSLAAPKAWPLQSPVLYTPISVVGSLLVLPLSIRQFGKTASH
jgi:ABC-2 type transport system permease protein